MRLVVSSPCIDCERDESVQSTNQLCPCQSSGSIKQFLCRGFDARSRVKCPHVGVMLMFEGKKGPTSSDTLVNLPWFKITR
ncbi:hypothetical protein TNCV_4045681 [Trichonephila clavipes]|nr:hypothetical protein TNCV_4045681 [Trichonephila clavipes]